MKIRLLLLTFSITTITHSQTFDWWKNLVHWDGVTYWSKYIIYSPGFMGVNALPVPKIGNGSIDDVNSIAFTACTHFSRGDNSQNPILYANINILKDKVSLDANWVPVEWFQMSHAIKEKRRVYWEDYYLKKAHGDINMNMNIQLFNQWRKNIHLAVRIGYRFPTSDGVGAARMTDMPGYFFDISAGKLFSKNSNWKWIGMAGFYVWQTNNDRPRLYQDDAFLTGTGVEFNKNKFRFQTYIAGYFGYVRNHDDPIVYRLNFERKCRKTSWIFNFQQGIHDVHYTSFESGIKFNFDK